MSKVLEGQKIKFAVLLDSYDLGGSAKVVLQNLKAAPQDFDVLAIVFTRDKGLSSPLIEKFKQSSISFEVIEESFAFDPRVVFKIIRTLKSRSIDIIESNHYKTHFLALFAAKFLKIPWVAVSHGWTAENLKVKIYNLLDRFTLQFCNAAVALGPSIALKLKNMLASSKRPRCMPTAFDVDDLPDNAPDQNIREKLSISESTFLFAAIGRLSYEKGFDILIEAARLLLSSEKDFQVLIIGSGGEESRLKKKAADLNLGNNLKFLGQKTSQELFSYYSVSDCVLIPSRSEGLPNVLLESAFSNLPVIASSVGGIPDFMNSESGTWLFDAGDFQTLADLMSKIMKLNKVQRDQIGLKLNARLLSAYTAKLRTKKVYRLYRALIRKMNRGKFKV